MKNISYLIIVLTSLVQSCNYVEETKISYIGYYDSAHTILNMKGSIIDKREEGMWVYYDENGQIIKEGNFEYGFQKDKWVYRLPNFESTIFWEPYFKLKNFTFSLPTTFRETRLDYDTLLYSFKDTSNGEVFILKDIGKRSQQEVEDYFDLTINGFQQDYFVNESISTINKKAGFRYHLDTYSLTHKASRKDLIMYSIYDLFGENLLVFGYCVNPKDSVRGKVLINDIFYHTTFNQKRVADPFPEISEIIKKYQ